MELIIGSDHMQDVADVTAEYPYALHPLVSSAETRVPWHWHEEVEFSLVRRGALQVTVAGRQQILSAGEGMFLNTNVLHAMAAADPAAETSGTPTCSTRCFWAGTTRASSTANISPRC